MADIVLHQPILGRAAGATVTVTDKEADYYVNRGYASRPGSSVDFRTVVGNSSVASDLTATANREGPDAPLPSAPEPTVVPRDDLGSTQDREVASPPAKAFNPGEHTVAEVNAYLAAHPKDAARVLGLERENKARTTILEGGGAPPVDDRPQPEPEAPAQG